MSTTVRLQRKTLGACFALTLQLMLMGQLSECLV